MEEVSCDLCGSKRYREIYSMPDILFHPDEWFSVVECIECGLGFTNPRPSATEIGRYYPPEFFANFEVVDHRYRYAREAAYLEDLDGSRRLLDVGCANGDFPRFMRARGWDVTGVETSLAARVIDDFPVFRCELPGIPLEAGSFDAITAWAVLEHVHNPRAYFAKVADLLVAGGRFVFLVTNFESWPSRYLFREDLPRHLYFFTEKSVRRYMREVGLELMRVDHSRDIFDLRSVNWLRFVVYRYLLRRQLRWEDLPERPAEYFGRFGGNGLVAKLCYVITHPSAVLDRMLLPAFELFAPKRVSRGAIVFVARKRA